MNEHKDVNDDFKLFKYCLLIGLFFTILVFIGIELKDDMLYAGGFILIIFYLVLAILFWIRYNSLRTRLMIADMLKKDYYPKYCLCDKCKVLKENELG